MAETQDKPFYSSVVGAVTGGAKGAVTGAVTGAAIWSVVGAVAGAAVVAVATTTGFGADLIGNYINLPPDGAGILEGAKAAGYGALGGALDGAILGGAGGAVLGGSSGSVTGWLNTRDFEGNGEGKEREKQMAYAQGLMQGAVAAQAEMTAQKVEALEGAHASMESPHINYRTDWVKTTGKQHKPELFQDQVHQQATAAVATVERTS